MSLRLYLSFYFIT